MPSALVEPVMLDVAPGDLCRLRYAGHPRGCPNYGKRVTCPPAARPLDEVLDLCHKVTIVWNVFDIGAHIARMRALHPDWSERQCACCLYWQGTARKALREELCYQAMGGNYRRDQRILHCPEGCGVNVTATMKELGHELEWPPRRKAYQVAILGHASERTTR